MKVSARALCAAAFGLTLAFGALGSTAHADDRIGRGEAPAWVSPASIAAATPASAAGEAIRVLLFDVQYRAEHGSQSMHIRTRSTAVTPQGLAALGNVGLVWSPASQEVTVHHVRLIRGDETIDVLATQSFETLRREENLALATLDGRLTAVLQPAGLRVGDILDVAYTLTSRDPVVGDFPAQATELNLPLGVGHQRFRASWPADMPMAVQASNNWTSLPIRRSGGYASIEVSRDDTQPILVPYDVPGRMGAVNRIELSAFRNWAEVATSLAPLYSRARQIAPDSPLHAEIARIRALSDDPAVQTAAALRLVQDEVRYVALLMGEGALVPASADETWARRFGDCKGKTALLLALLDGLGISAEPAAASLMAGDGVDERLPSVGAFDHVLVRASVEGQTYWLDGTRIGDRRLEDIQPPLVRWALPLIAEGGALEAVEIRPPETPQEEILIAFDASAGQHAPAALTATMIMRGPEAAMAAGQIGLVTAAQRDQGLRSIWAGVFGDVELGEVASEYDAEANILTLTAKGSMALDWRSDGLIPPGATYLPLTTEPRTAGPFQNAPYVVDHPNYSRRQVTVLLPNGGENFRVSGGEFDRTELAHRLSRSVRLDGDTVTVEIIQRSLAYEVPAAEANAARAAAEVRPNDRPKIIPPANYQPTAEDRTAMSSDLPTTADGWVSRAYTLSRAGDNAGALEAANRAVELSPESSNAIANRGIYRFWAGDRAGAAADMDRAVELDPSERVAMNGNALLANVEGRHQDVIIETTRALRQAPTDDFALGMRARAYLAQNQYDRALRDIDALIALDPMGTEVRFMRLYALDLLGRDTDADETADALVRDYPDNPTVVLGVAAHRMNSGRNQDAYQMVDHLISVTEEPDAQVLILRGELAIALGHLEITEQDFAQARLESGNADVLNNLCWAAARGGVFLDQALRDCDAALALAPASVHIQDSKGRVLLQRGDYAAARDVYDAVLAEEPELVSSLYGRGLAKIALGDAEAGEADKAAAVALYEDAAEDFENFRPSTSN
ncbi:MAG: DUF3857 domain-containing protein [Brevundimonas sp.]|nr:DUF3857 domain-containing protein [Brevundimonas sp.]